MKVGQIYQIIQGEGDILYVGHALIWMPVFRLHFKPRLEKMPKNLTFFICHEGTLWRHGHQKGCIKKQSGCHMSTLKQESTEMVFFSFFFPDARMSYHQHRHFASVPDFFQVEHSGKNRCIPAFKSLMITFHKIQVD